MEDSSTSDVAPVALVVVHGIGRQKTGNHLVEVTDRLAAFVERRGSEIGTRATVTKTALRTGERARSDVTFTYGDDSRGRSQLRVYEAYWAEAFHPPTASAVFRWLAWVAPLTMISRGIEIVTDSVGQWGGHPLHWWRIASSMLIVLLGFPLALACVLVVGAAALLRPIVPFSSLQDALARLELTLSQVLGDSFLYTMSPTNASAAVTEVAETIHEAAQECDEVVVLAHSQGAQIAVDALAASTARADTLITYGAGIGQLEWLKTTVARDGWSVFVLGAGAWLLALAGTAWLVVLIYGLQHGQFEELGAAFGIFAGWWLVPAAIVGLVRFLAERTRGSLFATTEHRKVDQIGTWVDLSATADLVSGRPVVQLIYADVNTTVVANGRNLLTDHSGYLKNSDEVLPRIAQAVLRPAARLARLCAVDDSDAQLRHVTTRWLVTSRILVLALVAGAIAGLGDDARAAAEDAWSAVTTPLSWVGWNPPGTATVVGVRVDTIALLVTVVALSSVLHWLNSGFVRAWRSDAHAEPAAERDRISTGYMLSLLAVFAVMVAVAAALVTQSTTTGFSNAVDAMWNAFLALWFAGFLIAVVGSLLGERIRARLKPEGWNLLNGVIWTWAGLTIVLLPQAESAEIRWWWGPLLACALMIACAATNPVRQALVPLLHRSLILDPQEMSDSGPRLILAGTVLLIASQVILLLTWDDIYGLLQSTVIIFSFIGVWAVPLYLSSVKDTHPRGFAILAALSSAGFAALIYRGLISLY